MTSSLVAHLRILWVPPIVASWVCDFWELTSSDSHVFNFINACYVTHLKNVLFFICLLISLLMNRVQDTVHTGLRH